MTSSSSAHARLVEEREHPLVLCRGLRSVLPSVRLPCRDLLAFARKDHLDDETEVKAEGRAEPDAAGRICYGAQAERPSGIYPFVWFATNGGGEEAWLAKFTRNIDRDRRARRDLRSLGWDVMVVWECQLTKKTIDTSVKLVVAYLEL